MNRNRVFIFTMNIKIKISIITFIDIGVGVVNKITNKHFRNQDEISINANYRYPFSINIVIGI